MAIINADTSNFNAKLASLKAGDTLQLATGNYGALNLANLNFGSGVTIKGGSFTIVNFSKVSGVTLDGATVTLTPTLSSDNNAQAIRVWGSEQIHITNAKIIGGLAINGVAQNAAVLDGTGNVLGLPAGKGINFESTNNSSITNSDISFFHKGVTFSLGSNLTIANNNIHDLRTTPISGSAVAGLIITGNHTWDSHPWNFGGNGDHGDRIHVWTDKTAISGVVISNNFLEQGKGDALLGIYLDDNGKKLGFPGAVITGNTIIDGTGQGVLLENVSGVVSGNTLIWSGSGNAVNNAPRFQISGGTHDVVFTHNKGDVTITPGSFNLQFNKQIGSFTYNTGLSSDDRLTITQDDTVVTAAKSFALAATVNNLVFSGTGDFNGTGNALANSITGGKGNDILRGNGGADVLDGGLGNDSYYIDNSAQKIIDIGGVDTVYSSIPYSLQSGLENLIYTGSSGATLVGNGSDNRIVGGDGNDILIGGLGADKLEGGLGNDTYYVDNLTQVVIDTGGFDTVITDRSYILGSAIENLTLTGNAASSATGNALNNILRGNAAGNIIDGGLGVDTLYGGGGNDVYLVDNVGDIVIEVENGIDMGGIDLVRTTAASYTLPVGVENLSNYGGIFTGTGNALANVLTGGQSNDDLSGAGGNDILIGNFGNDILNGGSGSDTLTGGAGNDIFVFAKGEANGDSITDFFGNGAAQGDIIKLSGWGAGTTISKGSGATAWVITDGVDHSIETIFINGAVHISDVIYG